MTESRRPRLDPAIAAVRSAVRASLADLTSPGDVVLAGCSGGPDSLALAAGLAFEAGRAGVRAGAVTVDHGLQSGSAERAADLAVRLTGLGLDPVDVRAIHVGRAGGPEGAARVARYAALAAAAEQAGAALVLLGHTRDDQAETVLLGLARGSGARSLSGMSAVTPTPDVGDLDDHVSCGGDPSAAGPTFARPLLQLARATTHAACAAAGLVPWADPHNDDQTFARSRVRGRVLPVLEEELGPGVAEALARSSDLLRDDADALDAIAAEMDDRVVAGTGEVGVAALVTHPRAVRTRILRRWLIGHGAPPTDLKREHVIAVEDLATRWHGQGPLTLPGGLRASREPGPGGAPVLRLRSG